MKPNILWLTLESVRADHTSVYGYHKNTTPFLEKISQRAEATVLDPMIASSMWTPASTASMLTGTYLSTHQLGQDGKAKHPLPAHLNTLPELLGNHGYQTALFGANGYISTETGLTRGFDHVDSPVLRKHHFTECNSQSVDAAKAALQSIRQTTNFSIERILANIKRADNFLAHRVQRYIKNQSHTQIPFFAYAHIPSPHHQYEPVNWYKDQFLRDTSMSNEEAEQLCQYIYDGGSEQIKTHMADGLDLSGDEWRAIKGLYDAEIRHVDDVIQKIVTTAESASDGPLIAIIVGDHGDLFGERGLIGHNLVLHDGLTVVPGIVLGIDNIREDNQTISQHIDLSYTVAKLTDTLTDQFEGRDLRDAKRTYAISQRGVAHLDAYTKHNSNFDITQFFKAPFTAVRTHTHKLLRNDTKTVLYETHSENNPTDIDSHSGTVSELIDVIKTEDITWKKSTEEQFEYDRETADRLRELGYLT